MKLPDYIYIGSFRIEVVLVDDLMKDASRGWYDSTKLKIQINKDLDPQQQFSVFIHECEEAINDLWDLNLKEPQICVHEQAWTQIILQLCKGEKNKI